MIGIDQLRRAAAIAARDSGGEIEIVEGGQQMARINRDLPRHFAILRAGSAEQFLFDDLGKAQYRIERRPQFMDELPQRIRGQAGHRHGRRRRARGHFMQIGSARFAAKPLEAA